LLTWKEVDLKEKLLRLPGERTTSGNPFVVPLSDAAAALLESARDRSPDLSPDAYVFPGMRPGRPLSNIVFEMCLRKMQVDATPPPHGFRSSFRDCSPPPSASWRRGIQGYCSK
jgi:integrase